jgi:C4-dicarboxylate transporter
MSESYIDHSSTGATSFVGPDAVKFYAVARLKGFIGLWIKTKMIPTRGITITVMLGEASKVTGKTYKPRDAQKAVDDLQVWIDTMKAALPRTVDGVQQ